MAHARAPRRRRTLVRTVLATSALTVALAGVFLARTAVARARPVSPPRPQPPPVRIQAPSGVWLVEKSACAETYSNGLRVETCAAAPTRARSCGPKPAGIVFHTTESRQAPFEADQNGVLKRLGESVLDFVRRRRAYNFLIDRFGRVYRVVPEDQAANHAGHSVWADGGRLYIDLNESFLGVSFEAAEAAVSPAQVRVAGMLTEMLRARYGIPAANCVTHAQVSVNPSNMRGGYHTDWASDFPFAALGLPDNYSRPLPALTEFGFEYDQAFLSRADARLRAGLDLADEMLRARAAEAGLRLPAYRKTLRERYRTLRRVRPASRTS